MLFSADKEGANVWGIKALFWPDRFFRWWKKVWDKIAPYEVETEEDSALVTELKNAHGVQITTRFGGHETLFAYRELGRRAIVALSGITLTRAHKNLAPQVAKDASTTVNVNQQAAAGVQIQSPKDVLAEIVESAREDNAGQ